MSQHLRIGSRVKWTWGAHEAEGRIAERFTRKVSRTIEGTRVTRQGSAEEPAFLVEQDDGGRGLKSASELSAAR